MRESERQRRIANISHAFAEVEYKPGWYFEIKEHSDDSEYLSITLCAPTWSLRTGKPVKGHIVLSRGVWVKDGKSLDRARGIAHWMGPDMIRSTEDHEQQEWLTIRGRFATNPHPGIKGYKGVTKYRTA